MHLNLGYKIVALIVALGHGIAVAAAVGTFISILGITPRLATITGTKAKINIYGTSILLGIFSGSALDLFEISGTQSIIGQVFFVSTMLLWGIFTGMILCALAEFMDVVPSIVKIFGNRSPISIIVVVLAVSKIVGSLIYWLTPYFA